MDRSKMAPPSEENPNRSITYTYLRKLEFLRSILFLGAESRVTGQKLRIVLQTMFTIQCLHLSFWASVEYYPYIYIVFNVYRDSGRIETYFFFIGKRELNLANSLSDVIQVFTNKNHWLKRKFLIWFILRSLEIDVNISQLIWKYAFKQFLQQFESAWLLMYLKKIFVWKEIAMLLDNCLHWV